jgi:predicted ATPase
MDQLNWGVETIDKSEEKRIQLERYNLIAARKAEDPAAYVPAFKYATGGIDCLGGSASEMEYALALRLYTKA